MSVDTSMHCRQAVANANSLAEDSYLESSAAASAPDIKPTAALAQAAAAAAATAISAAAGPAAAATAVHIAAQPPAVVAAAVVVPAMPTKAELQRERERAKELEAYRCVHACLHAAAPVHKRMQCTRVS